LIYNPNTRALQVVTLLIGGCGLAGSAAGQTWGSPQFVTNGSQAVALATNGSGTSAILFWLNGPGLIATVGKNGVWSTPVSLSTATSVGSVAVAPNGDVLAVWSFHTNNPTTPIETQVAFYSGGHWGNTIIVTTNGSATPSSSLAHLVGLGFDGNSNATLVWEQLSGGSSCAGGGDREFVNWIWNAAGAGQYLLGLGAIGGHEQRAGTRGARRRDAGGGAGHCNKPGKRRRLDASIDVANPYYGWQRPWVGLGNNGTAAVVWRARTFGEYAVRENGVWSAPTELPQGTGSTYPKVAVDGSGNAVAAYLGKVSYRPAGGTFQTPVTLGSGEVLASPGGTFVVSGTSVAMLLPGSKTWNQNGPSSGLVAIGPGEAIAVMNPSIRWRRSWCHKANRLLTVGARKLTGESACPTSFPAEPRGHAIRQSRVNQVRLDT